jgi:hypothetical protein
MSPLSVPPSEFEIDTDPFDFKLPGLFLFCGSRGSGKTYACVALVKHFESKKYIKRTFLISPTYESNEIFSNLKTLRRNDICDDENTFDAALMDVKKRINDDWETYRKEEHYRKVYLKARDDYHNLTLLDMNLLEEENGRVPLNMEKPSHLLIVDDCQGTVMYSNYKRNAMNHMLIKHRHIPVTICFLAQSWTGVPRVLRLNATHFALFATADRNQLKQIYDAFGNLVTFEQFEAMFKASVAKPHGFLFIDTVPKKEKYRFRSGFDTLLQFEK